MESKTIKNPLTIIAIFASLAEICGTYVLPNVSEPNQTIFVWFLIAFPATLLLLFFLTLNFNHKVLYAPSDYKNEDNFFRPSAANTRSSKLRSEVHEVIGEDINVPQNRTQLDNNTEAGIAPLDEENFKSIDPDQTDTLIDSPIGPHKSTAEITKSVAARLRSSNSERMNRLIAAETLGIRKVEHDLGVTVQRDIELNGPQSTAVNFDGIFFDQTKICLVEVKYVDSLFNLNDRIDKVLQTAWQATFTVPEELKGKINLVLAIVLDDGIKESTVKKEIRGMISNFKLPIEIKYYSYSNLIDQFDE